MKMQAKISVCSQIPQGLNTNIDSSEETWFSWAAVRLVVGFGA